MKRTPLLALLAFCLLLPINVMADGHKVHRVLGVVFSTPIAFGGYLDIGKDTQWLVHPPGAFIGREVVELVVQRHPSAGVAPPELAPDQIALLYLKGQSGKIRTRKIMGRPARGFYYNLTTPSSRMLEVYRVPIGSQEDFLLALRWRKEFSNAKAEAIMAEAARTLKVDPKGRKQ